MEQEEHLYQKSKKIVQDNYKIRKKGTKYGWNKSTKKSPALELDTG